MKTGILKEPAGENRVVMLPESVSALVDLKTEVLVEKGAGENAFVNDPDYEEAGAKIASRADVIKASDLVLSISPPSGDDLKQFKSGQALLAVISPFFNPDLVKDLAGKEITCFSMDIVPRTSRAQSMDILSSQAMVAGYKAVLDAAMKLPKFFPMFMSAAGTIKPAKVLILGAGVAGLQAISIARKLGAVVEVFDVRSAVKEEVQSLGAKFVEVEGAKDDKAAGGYAVEQTEEYKQKQAQAIHDHAVKSDVVICTAQIPGKKAPLLLKKDTVETMQPGSVIIDLAASTGGNCELTRNDKVVEHKQISIVGPSNYPGDMPMDASRMFGKNVVNFLKLVIGEEGNFKPDFEDDLVAGTCLTHAGEIKFEKVKELIQS